MNITTREFLEKATLTKQMVDRFLHPDAPSYAIFDAELGYIPKTCVIKDGLDGSHAIYRYSSSGERLMLNFADQPPRVNTYGDSFTQCNQVSDGETWQEYLAAHLGEPIRNFGVGGYGVYQAHRRMLKEEKTASSAQYVLLNIFSDDHFRSLYTWRMLHLGGELQLLQRNVMSRDVAFPFTLTGPWAHIRLNLDSGRFEERENPYPTPESLYQLCDKAHVYETFKDDFDVQVRMARHKAPDVKLEVLQNVADVLDMPTDFSTPEAIAETAYALLRTYALRASMYIVDRAKAFADAEGKKLMVLLSYSGQDVVHACRNRPRFDQSFVDDLAERELLLLDALQAHVEDFKLYRCSPEQYVNCYYIGHYSPKGNHFFAFAVKDPMVEWLNPKPPTYRAQGPSEFGIPN